MKTLVQQLLAQSIEKLIVDGVLPADAPTTVHVERTRDRTHGDFASNLAMSLTKIAKRKPRELAELIVAALPESDQITKVDIAGPGFINLFLAPAAYHALIAQVFEQGEDFGRSDLGGGKRIQVEFVSANPTGPLHVGHGRGAAFGATLSNLLSTVGFDVQREYYVNDAGRQMDILAASVWLRYLGLCAQTLPFPVNGYKGDYVLETAQAFKDKHGEDWFADAANVLKDLPPDECDGGSKETYIDALVARAKQLLGAEKYRTLFDHGLDSIRDDIRDDLHDFGVDYDRWFSERSLTEGGAVDHAIERLVQAGHTYEKGGALWFRSSELGDDKDRVVKRDNGQTTYFASDIAYLLNKFERGFEQVIYVWGADHHGYVPRVKAACRALGHDDNDLEILLVQFAILYQGGERISMGTRAGKFVTLRQLREEITSDAARFFYVMRKSEQHMDFDLDLAKSRSNENPLYYIQYAHARVCSVLRQTVEKGYTYDAVIGGKGLHLLSENHEDELMLAVARYPEMLESAAINRDPHLIAHYLRELSTAFHTYYNAHTFLVEDAELRNARLNLILAAKQVIANGLALLGASAPESM